MKGEKLFNDEWALTNELRRLNKYGFLLRAKRTFEGVIGIYDIIFVNSQNILEPNCSIEEVVGITNSLETCLEINKRNNESRIQHGETKT